MTKTKSTKRALLMSALALITCVSMLVGSTFAWFTDSVTSGNNIIQSGNLDVELEYKKVVDGAATEWATVKDKTDIFNPTALWEPGHVEVVYLKVSNLGSLELKYQLGVNVIKETLGKNEAGADIKLSDHLVFKAVEITENEVGTYTRESAKTAAGAVKGLKDYNGETTALGVGDKDYVALIVYMPETVGNEANYRGTDIPTIELGINLYATQFTAEEDSFDELYDKNAWADGMKVYDANDLQAALANGKDAVLQNDIALTETVQIPEGATVALNLNGKTITGGNNQSVLKQGMIVNNGELTLCGGGTIKVTVDNAYSVIDNNGTLVLNDVTIDSTNYDGTNGVPMYAIRSMNNLIVNDGAVVKSFRTIAVNKGTATFNGGEITTVATNNVITVHTVYVYGSSSATFNGGTFKNLIPTSYASNAGAATICDATTGEIVINGGYFESTVSDYLNLHDYGMGGPVISVKGGTFKFNPAAKKIATGYKAIDNGNGTYTVLPNVGTDLTAVAGHPGVYKANGENYYVASADALVDVFATIIPQNVERAQSVSLLADIDLSGKIWEPLDNQHVTINGMSHTIRNLTAGMAADGRRSGFFGYAGGVTINDLTLENVDVTGSQVGAFAGAGEGLRINNCFLKGDNKVTYIDGIEDWNGIGAITGVLTGSAVNVEIVDGATVTLNKAGFVTDSGCTFFDNLTGYLNANAGTVVNNGQIIVGVSTANELIAAIKDAPVGETTYIALADGTYSEDIAITVAALGKSGGDVVIKAAKGANPVISGTVTLGYRNQGVGATMYNANITFEGITFDHAAAANHSLDIQDVKSLNLKNCTIIGDGEYGIISARGNGTGPSKIEKCTFVNAAVQPLGNYGTGLVIDGCTFNNSRINVQAGNSVTVQNCEFNNTLTAANVGDSFYAIRSNSTPITVKDCKINIDSELTEVAAAQAKWYLLANRGTTNWTVENVAVTLTEAALMQTELDITACTSSGKINATNLTVNGVDQ